MKIKRAQREYHQELKELSRALKKINATVGANWERIFEANTEWDRHYRNSLQSGLSHKAASGEATRLVSRMLKVSRRQVRNIRHGEAVMPAVRQLGRLMHKIKSVKTSMELLRLCATAFEIRDKDPRYAECRKQARDSERVEKATGQPVTWATAFLLAHDARVAAEAKAANLERELKKSLIKKAAAAAAPGYSP